jgi:hypothetical protein
VYSSHDIKGVVYIFELEFVIVLIFSTASAYFLHLFVISRLRADLYWKELAKKAIN